MAKWKRPEVHINMGITIHYTFVRRQNPHALMAEVNQAAKKRGMKIEHNSSHHLVIAPHPQCEWIDLNWRTWKEIKGAKAEDNSEDGDYLNFLKGVVEHYYLPLVQDNDWICVGFTKTQFAGVDCHCAVAELLRFVASRCRLAEIGDEASYYEDGLCRYEKTKEQFDRTNKVLGDVTALLKAKFGADNVICGQDLSEDGEAQP
jgi:hypothetical protein